MVMIKSNCDIFFGLPAGIAQSAIRFEDFPLGCKVKLRLRNDEFAQAFSITKDREISWWYVSINDGVCRPTIRKGLNLSISTSTDALGRTKVKRRLIGKL